MPQELQDAQSVGFLVEAAAELLYGTSVCTQRSPQVVGFELCLKEAGEVVVDILRVEAVDELVGICHFLEGCGTVERVALPVAGGTFHHGGTGTEGDAVGEPGGRIDTLLVPAAHLAHLAELLQQVEVLAALYGRDAADFPQRGRPHHDGAADGCERVRTADGQHVERIVPHVDFVTQDGTVFLLIAGESVVVGNRQGHPCRMACEAAGDRLKVVGAELGVGIHADDEVVAVGHRQDVVEEGFPCPADAMFLAVPAIAVRRAVDDFYREGGMRAVRFHPLQEIGIVVAYFDLVGAVPPSVGLVNAEIYGERVESALLRDAVEGAGQPFSLIHGRYGHVEVDFWDSRRQMRLISLHVLIQLKLCK